MLAPEGVRSATDFWEEYAAGTRPCLTEHVLVDTARAQKCQVNMAWALRVV
jgi:hypothetical protein